MNTREAREKAYHANPILKNSGVSLNSFMEYPQGLLTDEFARPAELNMLTVMFANFLRRKKLKGEGK